MKLTQPSKPEPSTDVSICKPTLKNILLPEIEAKEEVTIATVWNDLFMITDEDKDIPEPINKPDAPTCHDNDTCEMSVGPKCTLTDYFWGFHLEMHHTQKQSPSLSSTSSSESNEELPQKQSRGAGITHSAISEKGTHQATDSGNFCVNLKKLNN
jgi:hypothetical protein